VIPHKPAGTRRALTAVFNLDMAIGAFADGEWLGLAGLHSAAGIFSRVRLSDCWKQLDPLRGFYAWVVLNLFGAGAKCPPGHLRIAAIAVDEKARGKGLGSLILESIFAKAHREGFKAVRLEVVDTNLRAKKLYESLGFGVIETHAYPVSSGWLGFAKEYVMVKTL